MNIIYFKARIIIIQLDVEKIHNLRYAYENLSNKIKTTSFVCISSEGEPICAELKSNSQNALNISWSGLPSKLGTTAKTLPFLDKLLQKSNSIETSSFVFSDAELNKLECNKCS